MDVEVMWGARATEGVENKDEAARHPRQKKTSRSGSENEGIDRKVLAQSFEELRSRPAAAATERRMMVLLLLGGRTPRETGPTGTEKPTGAAILCRSYD